MAQERCKLQLYLILAEETHYGFSLLPARCKFNPHIFFGVPLTTKIKQNPYYFLIHLSLSRLNHWLPRAQAHPEVMQGTADLHHHIADAFLP